VGAGVNTHFRSDRGQERAPDPVFAQHPPWESDGQPVTPFDDQRWRLAWGNNTKWIVPLAAAMAAALAFVAYLYFIPGQAQGHRIGAARTEVAIVGPGILDALNKVSVTSRVAGFLSAVHVDNNSTVTRGQLIAELDAKEIESQLAAARADAQAASRGIDLAKSEYEFAVASRDKAAGDVRRRKPLVESGTVSQADFEAVSIADRQAQATLQRANNVAERAAAQAAAAWAQAKVLESKLTETKMVSPMNGVVVSRDRSPGDLLAPGTTLAQLVDPSSIVISARLDESIMGLLKQGQPASIVFTSKATRAVPAKVLRVGRSVDPETREFVVDVRPSELPDNWAIGQRASVQIHVELPRDTLAIRQTLVARQGGHAGVWKLEGGRARWKRIEFGLVFGDYIEVVSGLSRGDSILDPQNRYELEPIAVPLR
jgi:HlyD family secretion protein